MRDRATRRHHDERIIIKRLNICARIFGIAREVDRWPFDRPNRLRKHNLVCSCNMCAAPPYERPKHKPNWIEEYEE
jgi:hypothetical protein